MQVGRFFTAYSMEKIRWEIYITHEKNALGMERLNPPLGFENKKDAEDRCIILNEKMKNQCANELK